MNAWPLSISKRPDVRLYVQPSILGTWCFISVCGFWSIPGVEICWSGQWCILSHWLELYCWSSFFLLLLTLHRPGDIFWRSAERHGNCDTALQWTCKCLFLYVQSDGLYSSLINQLFQLSLGFFFFCCCCCSNSTRAQVLVLQQYEWDEQLLISLILILNGSLRK